MVTDGGGGAIIIWEDGRDVDNNKADIYAQRIGNDGTVAWTTNGIPLCALPDYQLYPGIATDGLGGAIVTWSDARNRETSGYDIYAQRVNPDGSVAWPEDGVVFCDATGDQWGSGPVDFIMDTGIVSDGAGGAIVTWWDTRSVAWSDVYAQRILPEGVAVWDTNGIVVSNYTGQLPGGSPNTRNIITDGAGGAIIAWESNTPADITARPCFEQCD